MHRCLRRLILGLLLLAPTSPLRAYEFELRYYRIEDPALAADIERTDQEFEARQKPIRELRRRAAYNTPEYVRAVADLERLQIERDQRLLGLLRDDPPDVEFTSPAAPGEQIRESRTFGEKRFNIQLALNPREGDRIALDIQADYDGAALYQGGALEIPLGAPHLASKAFVKLGDERRGSMVFVTVRP